MNYRIITSGTPGSLADHVNELIAEGWAPQGGISVAYSPGGGTLFAQAMSKDVK